MSIIQYEIEEVRKLCENVVENSKIIACILTPSALVRVDLSAEPINKNSTRTLTACLRFPDDYPEQVILIELKSRTLSSKFLESLTSIAEAHIREKLAKPQVLQTLRFLQQYILEHPLCVCFEEILQLRRELGANATREHLKLKQSTASIKIKAQGCAYYYAVLAVIPEDYPKSCVDLKQTESNLPLILQNYLNGQSREIARRCVEPPLNLPKQKLESFQALPSLFRALNFALDATKDFPEELCPVCEKKALPEDPKDLEANDNKDTYVERVYCGHLFHQGCLKSYMAQPPFPKDGKLCPAKQRHLRSDSKDYVNRQKNSNDVGKSCCGIRLSHDRWVVSTKLAEARWAHRQARERELKEVEDFWK